MYSRKYASNDVFTVSESSWLVKYMGVIID